MEGGLGRRLRQGMSRAGLESGGTDCTSEACLPESSALRYNPGLTPKTAFLFPGQGSQATGMGKALADADPAARRVFAEADDALGFAISRLCFEGPDDQLKLTENTQPALLTVSAAAFAVLQTRGCVPDYVA